jgi:hypothetical protein
MFLFCLYRKKRHSGLEREALVSAFPELWLFEWVPWRGKLIIIEDTSGNVLLVGSKRNRNLLFRLQRRYDRWDWNMITPNPIIIYPSSTTNPFFFQHFYHSNVYQKLSFSFASEPLLHPHFNALHIMFVLFTRW